MQVLIVEDQPTMRTVLRGVARKLEFTTVEAADGRAALDLMESTGPFDLALLDWDMPVMNGYEFLLAVRAREDWSSMRIIMVTSHDRQESIVAALQAGADDYLMKPVNRDMIVEKLRMLGLAA